MSVRSPPVSAFMGALAALLAGGALAQTTPESGADLNALPAHPDAVVAKPAPVRRRGRRRPPAPAVPNTAAADVAAIRKDEAIVHGATSATQAPTDNNGYTGGSELKGDILKSGPTGPQ